MKGTGWAVLIILFLLALNESTFIVFLLILALWAFSTVKRTGELPKISGEIEKWFVDKDKDRRNRR